MHFIAAQTPCLQRNVTKSENETKVVSHLTDLTNNFISALSIAVSGAKKWKFARTPHLTECDISGSVRMDFTSHCALPRSVRWEGHDFLAYAPDRNRRLLAFLRNYLIKADWRLAISPPSLSSPYFA
jgi:hypothetical protein